METTTHSAARLDAISTIQSIVPAVLGDSLWTPVDAIKETHGGRLRLFFVELESSTPAPSLTYSDGMAWTVSARIHTNYSGLKAAEAMDIAFSDGRQLYHALERRTSPVVPGLFPPTYEGFTPDNKNDGSVFGYHSVTMTILLPDNPN